MRIGTSSEGPRCKGVPRGARRCHVIGAVSAYSDTQRNEEHNLTRSRHSTTLADEPSTPSAWGSSWPSRDSRTSTPITPLLPPGPRCHRPDAAEAADGPRAGASLHQPRVLFPDLGRHRRQLRPQADAHAGDVRRHGRDAAHGHGDRSVAARRAEDDPGLHHRHHRRGHHHGRLDCAAARRWATASASCRWRSSSAPRSVPSSAA